MSEGTPKHYQLKIEPVVYIVENEMNFLDGNMIKYASRQMYRGSRDMGKIINRYKEIAMEYFSDYEPHPAPADEEDATWQVWGEN